jgi:TusA-related sulfurtransferase
MTADPEPVPRDILEVPGQSCAIVTPMIKERIRGLDSGDVLEVRTDDPAAREGVPAWSRLTGNQLVDVIEVDVNRTRFLIQKK